MVRSPPIAVLSFVYGMNTIDLSKPVRYKDPQSGEEIFPSSSPLIIYCLFLKGVLVQAIVVF
jgi:hypothetical protein